MRIRGLGISTVMRPWTTRARRRGFLRGWDACVSFDVKAADMGVAVAVGEGEEADVGGAEVEHGEMVALEMGRR